MLKAPNFVRSQVAGSGEYFKEAHCFQRLNPNGFRGVRKRDLKDLNHQNNHLQAIIESFLLIITSIHSQTYPITLHSQPPSVLGWKRVKAAQSNTGPSSFLLHLALPKLVEVQWKEERSNFGILDVISLDRGNLGTFLRALNHCVSLSWEVSWHQTSFLLLEVFSSLMLGF